MSMNNLLRMSVLLLRVICIVSMPLYNEHFKDKAIMVSSKGNDVLVTDGCGPIWLLVP